MVTAREIEERKAPVTVKVARPVRIYWSNKYQTDETKNKLNAGGNEQKIEDWEHKLVVHNYLESYKNVQGRYKSSGGE